MPVDFYVGGAEHTVGHLLYSRFITKALFDMKFVSFDEPFLKLRHQGMILGEDNRKMSKRWNNVIRPDEVAEKFGADTLRMYEMFMGPLEQSKPWNTRSLVGVRRLVKRIWRLKDGVKKDDSFSKEQMDLDIKDIENLVWNVTRYLEKGKYNLCVSEFMKYMNNVEGRGMITENLWEKFVLVLAPFAPFLAEELRKILKKDYSIHQQKWPKADSQKIKSAVQTIAVQINGKLRGTIEVDSYREYSSDEILEIIQSDKKIAPKLEGLKVKKVIYVSGKIANLVTE